jgi:hypothetical protein
MKTMIQVLEEVQDKLEGIKVPGTPSNLMNYVHGRCHVFAQASHEELGYEMEFLRDNDYWFEDLDHPSIVLTDVYCIHPERDAMENKYVDARGTLSKKMIKHDYECNSGYYEKYSLETL